MDTWFRGFMRSALPKVLLMRIRLHKILNEGRSVRFEKADEGTIDVNVIVFREPRPGRSKSE